MKRIGIDYTSAVWQGAGAATTGQWLVAATVPALATAIAATAVVLG